MYEKIHQDLSLLLKSRKDFRLMERRLNIGMALKQARENKRIKVSELVKKTGISRRSLDTLTRIGEVNTSEERFLKITSALGVSTDEFIRLARESAHYNSYHLKKGGAPVFKYRTHEVEIYSPPSFSRKDFVWCVVRIYEGQEIRDLSHETMEQVAGFVTNGHLGLRYANKQYAVHANQSFFLDPKVKHSFENLASSGITEFYLLYQLKPKPSRAMEMRGRKAKPTPISPRVLIEEIRRELSPNPDRLLPLPSLAAMSGIELGSLIHLYYQKTIILPFEKIDRLANLTDYSFENIIQKAENRYQGWVQIFTDQDKAVVDLSLKHGVHFYSHTGIGTGGRKFSICDITFDPWKENETKKEWKYRGIGFIGLVVQRGVIGIAYGTQPTRIAKWGETIYFNAGIPVTLSNPIIEGKALEIGESPEAKITVFSLPPIF